ncbi:MAG: hypothetical protein WDA71_12055 [Actinomycetota bacterium]
MINQGPVKVCMKCGAMHDLDVPSDGCTHFEIVEFKELHPSISRTLVQLAAARNFVDAALRTLQDAVYLETAAGKARILELPTVGAASNVRKLVRRPTPAPAAAPFRLTPPAPRRGSK